MSTDRGKTAEIEGPSVTCGACHFTSALKGAFSVEDGRLVWRGDADPQPCRGPDFRSCCEGRECGDFLHVTANWGDREFSGEEIAALQTAAEQAREEEMRRWHEEAP